MKMHWIPLLFGVFLILIGVGIILRAFGIDLPLARIFFALVLILVGISIIFPGSLFSHRGWGSMDRNTTVFSETSVEHTGGTSDQYNTVFGSQKIDLTKVDLSGGDVKIRVSAAFGSVQLRIDPAMPLKITGSSAFGAVQLPEGNTVAFGTNSYRTDAFKEGAPALYIDANVAFGGIEIKSK